MATLAVAAMAWWNLKPGAPEGYVPEPASAAAAKRPVNGIAVLPFEDLSPMKDQQWFAEGLSEEIRNLLASTPGLKVIGRSSSSAASTGDRDLRAIGLLLGVQHLLEGSVRKSDDQVRISAQLIDTSDGTVTWSDTHDGSISDIFALQDRVAAAVLDALKLHISTYPSRGRPTQNPEAYALLLKARLALNIQDAVAAVAFLQNAVELDPRLAEAWELLAHTYWTQPDPGRDISENRALIREAAGKALLVEPGREFSRALFIEGSTDRYLTADIIDALVSAATRQPNNSAILRTLSWNLIIAGYLEEGLAAAQTMIEVDPLSSIAHVRHAAALDASGRDAEAFAAMQSALKLSPSGLDWYVGEQYLSRGNFEQAIANFAIALDVWGISNTSWVKDFLEKVREGIVLTESDHERLMLATRSLTQDQLRFITTGVNRWPLLTGFLDDYYTVILDSIPDGQMSPDSEFYFWYGILNRERGFTAHPRFLEAATYLGLPEIWEQRGPPDFCSKAEGQWVCF